MKTITIQQVTIGDRERWTRTITEADVVLYAGLIGDRGPMHLDENFAKTTRFGGRVSYGMLNAGYIGAVLAQLLGIRSAYVGQTLKFLAPVMIGDTVTIEAEVIRKDEQRSRAWVRTTCTLANGTLAIDGEGELFFF